LQENFNRLAFWNAPFYAIAVVTFGYKNYLMKLEDKWIIAQLFLSLSHLFRQFLLYLPFGDPFNVPIKILIFRNVTLYLSWHWR